MATEVLTGISRLILAGGLFLGATSGLHAQQQNKSSQSDSVKDDFDIKNSSFLLPLPLPAGHYYHAKSQFAM